MGGAYPDDFTKDKSADDLRDVVKSMAVGQGGSALSDDRELAAQVAFHYAIDLKKPFLSWTVEDGSHLSGEVTPDAKVTAEAAGLVLEISTKNGAWNLVLPKGISSHQVVVKAKVDSVETTLDLSKSAFSLPATIKKS
jgi:hypothetical protein